jgi:glycosyltransferase involved in cell wall biosynthesis
MNVAFLTRYGPLGASSRVRTTQFHPTLAALGFVATTLPLLSDAYLSSLYAGKRSLLETLRCYFRRLRDIRAARRCDRIWIEKELLPYAPAFVELWLLRGRHYVLDYDDAIFHNYDLSKSRWVRWLYGRKIDALMHQAALVTVGNSYLEARARAAGARRVERLPSVIDLDRYETVKLQFSEGDSPPTKLRVVWIGSPATVRYLEQLREPFKRLSTVLDLELRVIGASAPHWVGVRTSTIPWSADTEASHIAACDIGVMPLDDTPWERGKCGFKLIQYMACGLPVVASPVGMNVDIVAPGVDGFLANTADEWVASLSKLADSSELRHNMGFRGRSKVENLYCVQVVAPRLAHLLSEVAS